MRVRYHPEDLSRVFVSADGRNYVEARYADLRRPPITLWEQRAAVRALRAGNQPRVSEALLFQAIEQQRGIVERGMPLDVAQDILGHSDPATTASYARAQERRRQFITTPREGRSTVAHSATCVAPRFLAAPVAALHTGAARDSGAVVLSC